VKVEEIIDPEDLNFPRGRNNLLPRQIFYFRGLYRHFIYPQQFVPDPIDLWYNNPLFGKVDNKGYPAQISERILSQIPSERSGDLYAVNFVADAWRGLSSYVINNRVRKFPNEKKSMYADMVAVNGWDSPKRLYTDYIGSAYQFFSSSYLDNVEKRGVLEFGDFVKLLIPFFEGFLNFSVITRESWYISRSCTPNVSGLILEISDEAKDDDRIKKQFLDDIHFDFVANSAAKFGFEIDKNAPWRFVADINSDVMQSYMNAYGFNLENIFTTDYYRLYETEIFNFIHYVWAWYVEFVSYSPVAEEVYYDQCEQKTKTKIKSRRKLSRDDALKYYSQYNWIRLFVFVKAKEMKKSWNQAEFDKVVTKMYEYLKYKDNESAFRYLYRKLDAGLDLNRLLLKENLTKEESDAIIMNLSAVRQKGTFQF
jgi:hypothetical protein